MKIISVDVFLWNDDLTVHIPATSPDDMVDIRRPRAMCTWRHLARQDRNLVDETLANWQPVQRAQCLRDMVGASCSND